MSSVFITATGTDIGKTYYAAKLLKSWVEQGYNPAPIKPLMSGFSDEALADSDAGKLLRAVGQGATPETINKICMRRYIEPVAPNQAARNLGQTLDYDDILAFVNSRVLMAQGEPVLVEGAGGIMSPVTDTKLHLDLINDLAMPAILVTANYLGSISHTLSAVSVMQSRYIPIEKIVVTRPTSEHGEPAPFIEEMSRWCDIPIEAAD
jgi:dethiobiotin synthetase